LGASDTDIHKALGWGLTALGALAVAGHFGAVVSFFSESVRFSHGDGTWLKAWPRAAVSGRFQRHEGHFDPGQRIANLLLVGGLGVLVASGIGLVIVRGGMTFVWLHRIHLWATYGTAVIIAGHIVVASGVLPGYRGVWRAMHGRGRVPETTAHRLWPTWFERRARR
jgi:formate dehydrogenase subunit gamma